MSTTIALIPRWLEEFSLSLATNPQVILSGNVHDLHIFDATALSRLYPNPLLGEMAESARETGIDGAGQAEMGDDSTGLAEIVVADTTVALTRALAPRGIQTVFIYDPVDGLRLASRPEDRDRVNQLLKKVGGPKAPKLMGEDEGAVEIKGRADVQTIAKLIEAVATDNHLPCALILDYANWLAPAADRGPNGSDQETELPEALRRASKTCDTAVSQKRGRQFPLHNPIVWLVRQQSELPAWLIGSEGMRAISVERPSRSARSAYGPEVLPRLAGYDSLEEADQAKVLAEFIDVSDGLTLREADAVVNLARDQALTVWDLPAAQRAYRVGVVRSEWEDPELKSKVKGDAPLEQLARSVHGQSAAVRKAAEIIQRAVLGLSGAETSANPSRPKGVLFFAGPTGVGKTLLAKAIADLVFSEGNYTRFDMSEYSQDHSEARLIGSPPGYVGHSEGGQLTEAVRQKPFSLLLFDEVEKAHPRILDKFLQILDEGRLTDGSGMTVNFSETIIVFTSNLGVIRRQRDAQTGEWTAQAQITYADRFPGSGDGTGITYHQLEVKVKESVQEYFESTIQRPELLNRVGRSNIVVFDFIGPDSVEAILDKALRNVTQVLQAKHGLILGTERIRGDLRAALMQEQYLKMGGRGINSAVEELFVNPLSHELAWRLSDELSTPGRTFPFTQAEITRLAREGEHWRLELDTR